MSKSLVKPNNEGFDFQKPVIVNIQFQSIK